jgi:very-short-patch-repair endonuclease
MQDEPPREIMPKLARAQRRDPSRAEKVLWTILRDRRISEKFRRQMPVGPYIADYICLTRRLIVEVDGPHHDDPAQKQRDEARQGWLASQGFRVLRLTSGEVVGDPDLATQKVIAALGLPLPKRQS